MKVKIFLTAAVLFFFYTGLIIAQPGNNSSRVYDVTTVVTISGEIKSIDQTTGQNGGGVHFTLKTSDGTFDIHLGPQWYIDEQSIKLNVNDNVSVTGSKVSSSIIVAKEVVKNNEKLLLRNENGIPLWSGSQNK
jgi:hypothetical protein